MAFIDLRLYSPSFEVIDESPHWIVVNKPAHLLTHPNKPGNPPTLLDGLVQLLAFEVANGARISVMNRLDRETSGLVFAAKHAGAAARFGIASQERSVIKRYLAIVWGWPSADHFRVEAPIRRRGEFTASEIHVEQAVHPGGRPCVTEFEVMERFRRETANGDRFSLLRCRLHTGRMHQIRVHLAHVGHPVVGDKIYGPSRECYLRFIETGWTPELARTLLLDRQALHAAEIVWEEHGWASPLPSELAEFLEKGR